MKRIASLDGLRAVSITLVMLGHLYGDRGYPQDRLAHWISQYAHFGVEVFFVISGFLITSLLLKEEVQQGSVDLRAFYIRRAYRILPAAFAYMAVVAFSTHISAKYLLYAVSYTMNYAGQQRPWLLGHLWSLSVEEQFYLLWPFAFFFLPRARRAIAWLVVIMAPVFRVLFWVHGWRDIDEYFPTVADALSIGCLLALYYPLLRSRLTAIKHPAVCLGLAAAALALPLLLERRFGALILFRGIVPAVIALLIVSAVEGQFRILNNRLATSIGAMSYSLYLWQQPFLNRNGHSWFNAFPVNLVLVFLCAWISYRWVEQPILRARSRTTVMKPKASIAHG
ncbi:MAG: acyltransferase [Acidobacteriaceae bacterium]